MQRISYMGNGSTTEFNFNFPFYTNTNIIVTKNGTTATGYTVVGTSAGENANIPYTGGKIVFETAPIATDSITIYRNLPLTRIVDYQPTAKIDPVILNQDQNYTMEVLKDFNGELENFDTKYNEIIDTESTQTLISKIDTASTQITNLGDISTLRQDVTDLKTTTGEHTTNITALNTLTNGMIDYVIASQNPTADNNYTWYRKYKSGWVEQGGKVSVPAVGQNQAGSATVTFSVDVQNYSAQITRTNDPGNTLYVTYRTDTRTTTTMVICYFTTIAVDGPLNFDWEVRGIAA